MNMDVKTRWISPGAYITGANLKIGSETFI